MHRFTFRGIRLPALPGLPIPSLPNPLKDPGKVVQDAAKAVEGAAKAVGKAVEDATHLPQKAAAELKRDLKKLGESRDRATKAVAKAVHEVVDAGAAVARFAGRDLRDTLGSAKDAMHGGNVFSLTWRFATSPIKNTNKNATQAMRESAALAATAQIAASAYGGPAGSAAYAAWMAYNASGGDLNLALRVGVTQGLVAAATGAAGKLTRAADREAAKLAIDLAVGKLQGKSNEQVMRDALASVVQTAGRYLPTGQLDSVQKALVSGAIGGVAVAAAGGNHKDIKSAFMESGGQVLVQDVYAAAGNLKRQAEAKVSDALASAIDPDQLAAAKAAYAKVKELGDSEVAHMVAKAKESIQPYAKAANDAAAVEQAEVEKLRNELLKKIDTATAKAQGTAEVAEQRAKNIADKTQVAYEAVKAQRAADIAAGKQTMEKIDAAAKARVAALEAQANNALQAIHRQKDAALADADRDIHDATDRLKSLRSQTVQELIGVGQGATAKVLADDWVLSWDKSKLRSTGGAQPAVVLTYAGEGSRVAKLVEGVAVTPPEPARCGAD